MDATVYFVTKVLQHAVLPDGVEEISRNFDINFSVDTCTNKVASHFETYEWLKIYTRRIYIYIYIYMHIKKERALGIYKNDAQYMPTHA